MAATPLVAVETATGTTGSDGLAVFTFASDINTSDHLIAVDRLPQGNTIDYTVTGARQITFVAPSIPLASARIWLWNGISAATQGTALPSWSTVATIVSDAAVELGLVSADIADPYSSTDPNILQLCRLLKSGGRELARRRAWTFLQKEYTFATVASTASYGLPSDFKSMVNDSSWDRTSIFPVGGPVDGQTWQYLKATVATGTITMFYRLWQGLLWLYPTPTSVKTVAFEYNSTSWVMPSGQSTPTSDAPSVFSDTVCFDPTLAVRRLKLDFLKAKGFDVTAAKADYDEALRAAESDDVAGEVIVLGGKPRYMARLLDELNVPETGYGS